MRKVFLVSKSLLYVYIYMHTFISVFADSNTSASVFFPAQDLCPVATARGGERCQHGTDCEFHRRGADLFLLSL